MDSAKETEVHNLIGKLLLGSTLDSLELLGSMLILRFSSGACLQLWDPWRICQGNLLFGFSDVSDLADEEAIPIPREKIPWLASQPVVEKLQVFLPFRDTRLELSDGSVIEHWLDSTDENWNLLWDFDRKGDPHKQLVCAGPEGFSLLEF